MRVRRKLKDITFACMRRQIDPKIKKKAKHLMTDDDDDELMIDQLSPAIM